MDVQIPRPSSEPSLSLQPSHLPPQPMSTAQDAQNVLAHLLAKLREPDSLYYDRYGRWLDTQEGLEDFLFRCVRPEVWRCLQTGSKNLDACKSVGGDIKSEGRGVYMNAVFGLDKRVRIYTGQSTHLRSRIAQHWNFRYRRDNPSLHYHALQNSIFNTFGILATLPSATPGNHKNFFPYMECPDILLNILELWCCLLFCSLPPQVLEEWLPAGVGKEWRGEYPMALNISNPLDQGIRGRREWLDLTLSEDPIVRDYLAHRERKRNELDYTQRQQPQQTHIQQQTLQPSQQEQSLQQQQRQQTRKSYQDKQKNYQEQQERKNKNYAEFQQQGPGAPVITTGGVFIICVAVIIGIAMCRSGGPTSRPR